MGQIIAGHKILPGAKIPLPPDARLNLVAHDRRNKPFDTNNLSWQSQNAFDTLGAGPGGVAQQNDVAGPRRGKAIGKTADQKASPAGERRSHALPLDYNSTARTEQREPPEPRLHTAHDIPQT